VIVPSSPLLPYNDPTLLFTNAGMNQFKPYFLGEEVPPFRRATTVQKCMRAGGKHNDLDNVGFTKRHHTFFEMLGNFSFGDYFKLEAIRWAWELLTEVYGLDKNRMWATVYLDDDEAYAIWRDEIGLPEERILRLGKKDNFWEMGDTGPCGPCSELHYDQGAEFDPNQKDPSEEGERYLELWNLVFMQYNRKEDGSLEPLPNKNIDTGMGLERLLAVLQGVDSNFHTDLFLPIIEEAERITGVKYDYGPGGAPFRVLADHTRALVFAITDGIYPSNFGRGYVLRRILRRAHRFAQKIGFEDKPIIYRLAPVVVEIMGDAYPELKERKTEVELIIKKEEEKFIEHVARNLPRLREALESARDKGVIEGEKVFKFYDTYGLPLDLIEEYAEDYKVRIDWEGFDREMARQKERAREKSTFKMEIPDWIVLDSSYTESEFVGYKTLESTGRLVKYAEKGKQVYIVLDRTPFYAESGGQVGDKGYLTGEFDGQSFLFKVEDTQKIGKDIVHIGKIVHGELPSQPVEVSARVDRELRIAAQRAHTATHLLHKALREILGEHARQEGSLVEPDRLRFDFVHFQQVKEEELKEIERIVNSKILENIEVKKEWMPYREAIKQGVMALFGEKYGETVRVVSIGDYSKELCGGTHVERTGDIGFFKIIKEESVASGIRRIEALVGFKALEYVESIEDTSREVAELLRTEPHKVVTRIRKLLDEKDDLEKELNTLSEILSNELFRRITPVSIDGITVYSASFRGLTPDVLKRISDKVNEKHNEKAFVVALATEKNGRAHIFVRISEDLRGRLSAKELVRGVSKIIQGGGGGSDLKAEGGGKQPSRLKEALNKILESVKNSFQGG